MMAAQQMFFTKDHEWLRLEDDDQAVVGVTEHAQETLGEITFVELPLVQKELTAGDEAAVVESSKAASDIFCPASGVVTEVNEALGDNPELINESCYKDGWIWKMKLADKSQLDSLMDEKAYEDYLRELE